MIKFFLKRRLIRLCLHYGIYSNVVKNRLGRYRNYLINCFITRSLEKFRSVLIENIYSENPLLEHLKRKK